MKAPIWNINNDFDDQDEPDNSDFDFCIDLDEDEIELHKELWWGYKHISGTIQAKRWFDQKDIQEAMESDFCEIVVNPFLAINRDDALKIIKAKTTY